MKFVPVFSEILAKFCSLVFSRSKPKIHGKMEKYPIDHTYTVDFKRLSFLPPPRNFEQIIPKTTTYTNLTNHCKPVII